MSTRRKYSCGGQFMCPDVQVTAPLIQTLTWGWLGRCLLGVTQVHNQLTWSKEKVLHVAVGLV